MGLVAALSFLFAFPSNSSAEAEIGTSGSGAGQLLEPRGVAVDRAEDLLYVVDGANNRIAVFDATSGVFIKAFGWGVADGVSAELQVCTTTCFKGIKGTGSGQFDSAGGIAVDNDPLSPGFHSIYVLERRGGSVSEQNIRIQKFTPAGEFVWMAGGQVNKTTSANLCTAASGNTCGAGLRGNAEGFFNPPTYGTVAVGPGGTVYVADQVESISPRPSRVQKFSPEGAYLGQLLLAVSGGAGSATGLAVDSGGNLYVGTGSGTGAVRKYDPSGNLLFTVDPSFNISTVAVDTDDNFYVGDNTDVSAILEFDSSGAQIRTFYGSLKFRTLGLFPYSTPSGDVIVSEEKSVEKTGRVLSIPFPPPGPVVYPGSTAASSVTNTKATLKARINPEGEPTTYYFEYITDEQFVAAGNSFGTGTQKTATTPLGAEDFVLHAAEVQLTGLFPETLYHFRVVTSNGSGTDEEAGTFNTKEPVEFGAVWSTDVGTQSTTLHAEVNPMGVANTARFEYVELSEWEANGYENAQSAPSPPIDLGEGEGMVEASTSLSGLKEGTSYRYRVVATNRCKPEPAPLCDFSEPEAEGTFITFFTLDPVTGCPNDQFRKEGSGTFLPNCRGYEMVSPVDKNGSHIEALFNNLNFPAALDQAALDGNSVTYSTYKAFGDVVSAPYTNQYLARRSDSGWATEAISPKREDPALMTYGSAQLDRQYEGFTDDLCSGWVLQDAKPTLGPGGIEGYPGLYRRDNCTLGTGSYEALTTLEPPATAPPNLPPRKFVPELQGFSSDGSVAIFTINDNLTADAPAQPQACIDESSPSSEACERRLYEARGEELNYVCMLPNETPYGGGCSAGRPSAIGSWRTRANGVSHAISDDGSRIFWTADVGGPGKLYVRIDASETIEISPLQAEFHSAAADGSTVIYSVGEKLFEFDVEEEEETVIAEGFQGMAGASDDASRVYFVSSKVLTGEEQNSEGSKAAAGKANLYLYETGTGFRFIGTVLESDAKGFGNMADSTPASRTSRVNANGQQIVFMAAASLTGYDNKDAVTKEPVMEVFLYDATANAGAGETICVSCNPGNARPEGRQLTQKFLTARRAAARIPTFQSQLYGQRVITDDGSRVYFDSFEALVSRDVNDEEDVYQWQELGAGECTEAAKTYSAPAAGCIDLISSGQSTRGSELVDISADGADVFIRTFESLVGQDPGLRDIYDARIGGGFAGPASPPIICEGEFCPQPAKDAPVAVAPASPAAGPGNPVWPRPKPKPHCKKGFHKKKTKAGKVRCVKNKKKRKAGQSRRASR
jgi:hypothetical protein